MRFPEKYTKRGKFRLHSGKESSVFYDINELLTDSFYMNKIISSLPKSPHYIGIATGGAIIAAVASREFRIPYSMIKDGELKGSKPDGDWTLIDDVTTTESSLKEALNIIGSEPDNIFVVMDRRKKKKLKLEAMFKI